MGKELFHYIIYAVSQLLFYVISIIAIILDWSYILIGRVNFVISNIPRIPKLLTLPFTISLMVLEIVIKITSYLFEFLIYFIFRFLVTVFELLGKIFPKIFGSITGFLQKGYLSYCSLYRYCPININVLGDYGDYEKNLLSEFQHRIDTLKRKYESKLKNTNTDQYNRLLIHLHHKESNLISNYISSIHSFRVAYQRANSSLYKSEYKLPTTFFLNIPLENINK